MRVEMLWESADPSAELARRFGFTDAGQVADWLTATLAKHWGVGVRSCERVVISAGSALAWIDTDMGRLARRAWSAGLGTDPVDEWQPAARARRHAGRRVRHRVDRSAASG